jgi:5-methyltetrahydropteroyltriglutamate--homocysteine methyltransferase
MEFPKAKNINIGIGRCGESKLVQAHLSGAFPRSEHLVEVTRSAARGQVSGGDLHEAFSREAQTLVDLQVGAGLDYVVDGQLNWQDLFRPFSEIFTGLSPGSLMRWFDNNTFYRKPIITQQIRFNPSKVYTYFRNDLIPPNVPKKAILPGPLTLANFSENKFYASFADLLDAIAHALKELLADLCGKGYQCVQFNEPSLCWGQSSGIGMEIVKGAYETCARGLTPKTCIHTYFGDAGPIIDDLLDIPVNCLGLDFYATAVDSLKGHHFSKELACGCIDGRNSLLETPNDVCRIVEKIRKEIEPKSTSVTVNCDLDFLPYPVAERKLRLLSKVKAMVN